MDENISWQRGAVIRKTAESLKKNNYTVHIAEDLKSAAAQALELIKEDESVAFGGSQTVKELGLQEMLAKRRQKIIASKPGGSFEDSLKSRKQALTADVYIASPNAVSFDGKLFFMDKIGNRAAGMMFGPGKVIAIAGSNKIVPDEKAARKRVETLAGPANTKRLALSTPCAETGLCSDCNSPARICNVFVTLLKKPSYTEYHVILIPVETGY